VSDLVARGVRVVETSTADGKVGVVAGRRSALAVDAGIDRAEGAAVIAAIHETGHRADWLTYTHGHVDHVLGSTAFSGANIVATSGAAAHIRRQVDEWAIREATSSDDLTARLGFPTITFDGDMSIDLGDREVRLIDTPGHAPGAVCVVVADVGLLFGGDTVVTGIPPTFRDGDSAIMEDTLRKIAELDVKTLVPGHGPIVQGREAVRTTIMWTADYVARCREAVITHPDADLAQLLVAAPYERLIGDRLPPDRHRMRWRHEQTMVCLIAERVRGVLLTTQGSQDVDHRQP